MSQSYYELLGIPTDASTEAIEAAYRERAKETHPDRSDAPDATEQFKAINRARKVLTDPRERARYDRVGHDAYVGTARPGFEWPPEQSPSDGDAGRRQGDTTQRRRERRQRQRRRARRERAEQPRAGASGDGARGDGFSAAFADAWWAGSDGGPFERRHAAETRSRSWYRPGADGDDGYRVSTRDDRGVQFTAERVGVALATFALYPLFVASVFLPAFPPTVNLFVGLCTLALVVYLLSVPETGVIVFGSWTLVAPFALTLAGVSLLSGLGILAWAFCWIPFVLGVANLLFLRA